MVGTVLLESVGGVGVCPFDLVVGFAIAGEVSEESVIVDAFGTVMNLEPSLFLYFAVALDVGEAGDWVVRCRRFAGIPIRGALSTGA